MPGGGLGSLSTSQLVAALSAEAVAAAGLADWGEAAFFSHLELLVESCRQTAGLTPAGWALLGKVVVRHLRNQLYLQAYLAAHPDVRSRPIEAPTIVTGLPRTGTTLLHNLLALDPDNRILRFWEGLHPVPLPGDAAQAALVEQAARWLARLYQISPSFRAIHYSTADGPEECDALLQNAFASQHFDDMFQAEAYSAWLNAADLVEEYAYFALQLQALDATDGLRRPWFLKSPSHLGYLDTVLATFPGALIVVCHRDPIEAVASYASLVEAVRAPHSEHVSRRAIGAHALNRCAVAADRALQTRARRGPEPFFDISYRQLTCEPLAVVETLYHRLDRTLSADARNAMQRWLDENPQHKQGPHHYSLDRFGLTPDSITRGLGGYLEQFGAYVR
jgi:hypothetical protein